MDQTSFDRSSQYKSESQKSPPVEIMRVLRSPIERVWHAWTDPELVKQWWGPKEFSSSNTQIDFRVGGKYLYDMKAPDGTVIWSGGEYKEIISNKKIVCTDYFSDKDGNIVSAKDVGMTGDWPESLYVTIEFERAGDEQMKLTIKHEGIPSEMHSDCIQGWSESIDKLQRLVEKN